MINNLADIKIEKTNLEYAVACAALAGYKGEPKIAPILAHYEEAWAGKKGYASCDNCKANSNPALDYCPLCGVGEKGEIDPIMKKTNKGAPSAATKEGTKMEATSIEKPNGKGKKSTEKPAGKPLAAPPAVTKPATPAAMTRASKDEEKAQKAAEAKSADAALVRAGVVELDKSIMAYRSVMGDGAAVYHRMGTALEPIHRLEQWKFRADAEGKRIYKSFEQFVEAELAQSHTNAFRMIEVAKKFSEDDCRKIGFSKISLIAEAPPESRPKLLKAAEKEGVTYREMATKVKEAKAAGGGRAATGNNASRTNKATAASKKKQAEVRAARITLVCGDKMQTIKLWTKADGDKPAKKLGDQPWGVLVMENDTRVEVSVKEASDGQLCISFKAKRGKE